jgi:hypothetical protein
VTELLRTQMPPAMTDDELVALALMSRSTWDGPLPTVDRGDVDALLSVSSRGFRTLVTRGLMTGPRGGTPIPVAPLLEGLRPAFSGDLRLAMYAATADLALVPGGPTGAVFAFDGGPALVDSVSALGIHFFSTGPVDSALAAVTRTARQVLDTGVHLAGTSAVDGDPGLVLCIEQPGPDGGGISLRVQAGSWSVSRIDAAGQPVEVESPASLEQALGMVFEADSMKEPS